jgi:MarR family transcriptional regulator, 2-MHQ and catechol-resistance regulon repressor
MNAPIPESPALKLWVVLSRAFTSVERHARADFARLGVSPGEFGALEVLYHKGPLPLGVLQRKILVSSGGLTSVVDRLEARGFVERRANPGDRRSMDVALTPDGEAWIGDVFPGHQRVIERALTGVPEDQIEVLTEALKQLGWGAQSLPVVPPDGDLVQH